MLRSSNLLRSAVLSLVAFSSLLAMGCRNDYSDEFRDEVVATDLEKFAQHSGINLPSDAKLKGVWITHRPYHTISLKVDVSDAQADAILEEGPLKADDLLGPEQYDPNDSEQSSFPSNRKWWDPGTKEDLRAGSKVLDSGGVLTIGVLQTNNGKRATLYLTWDERSADAE